jgi:hypothetical protein
MGIVMQLLIETCEFPNNTSPREWQTREETNARYSIPKWIVCQPRREIFAAKTKKSDPVDRPNERDSTNAGIFRLQAQLH